MITSMQNSLKEVHPSVQKRFKLTLRRISPLLLLLLLLLLLRRRRRLLWLLGLRRRRVYLTTRLVLIICKCVRKKNFSASAA